MRVLPSMAVVLAVTAPLAARLQVSPSPFRTPQEALAAGDERLEKRQFQEAKAAYNQALELARDASDSKAEGKALMGLCKTLREIQDHPAARKHLEWALDLFRRTGDRSGEAFVLDWLGGSYSLAGDQSTALAHYEKALPIHRELGDRRSEASTLTYIGGVYRNLAQMAKALACFEEALPIRREVMDRYGEATTFVHLGVVYAETGQKTKALECYEKSLSLRREVGDRRGEANVLVNIGQIYSQLGQNSKALEYYEKALPIQLEVGDRRGEGVSLGQLGAVYSQLGNNAKALEFYEKALPIHRETGERRGEAHTLKYIGTVYSRLGQKAKALEYYGKALSIQRDARDRIGETGTLNNIGSLHHELGENAKALEYYEKALPIQREVGDRHGEATVLNNIGTVWIDLGQLPKALECFEQSLPLRRELGDRRGMAAVLNNIGGVHFRLGQHPKALEYFEQALPIERAVGNRDGEAITLSHIGKVHSELGQAAEALEFYERALPIHREVGARRREATSLGYLMKVAELQRKSRLAVLLGKQAVHLCQQLRGEIRTLSFESRKAYLQTLEPTYRTLASLLLRQQRPAEAHQVISLLKEQEYFDFTQGTVSESDQPLSLAFTDLETRLLARFQQALEAVAGVGRDLTVLRFRNNRTPEEETRFKALQASHEEAQQAFEATLAVMGQELEAQGSEGLLPTHVKDLWADLKGMGQDSAVVYTLLAEDRAWLLGVTQGDLRAWEVQVPPKELAALVEAFQRRLRHPGLDPRPVGQKLYAALVAPLQAWRKEKRIRRLLWSLDGPLRYIPMGALWTGERYFLEELPSTVFTPAARMRQTARAQSPLALGAGVSKARGAFPSLPDVPRELGTIVQGRTRKGALPGEVLLDEGFTEASLRKGLQRGCSVLHVASHFQFSPQGEKDSFLLLGDGSHWSLEAMRTGAPLFKGLELLTLSACQTGVGGKEHLGREIEGFGVMAQRQGAGTVIASLWSVADASTSALMRNFYRAWSRPGATKAEAMRKAQLALLRGQTKVKVTRPGRGGPAPEEPNPGTAPFVPSDHAPCAHPYYWAPFVLMGNWK